MTPAEMARVFLGNIEATQAAMDDGPTGYVLQFADRMHLICESRGKVRKDHPLNDDVAVHTKARAVTLQRFWNHDNPDDPVKIVLRREALTAYIDAQRQAINILTALVDLANLEQPK